MLFFALFAACKEPVTTVVEAEDAALTLALVNPTSCSSCDAFAGLDQLRIDVLRRGVVVVSESFPWPGEAMSLPGLDGLGVVAIEVRGIGDGAVLSFGRSPEVALAPGATLDVAVAFLPVNRALPLTESMVEVRARHASFTLRDGRVLLAGGLSRTGPPTAGVEVFDPALGTFADAGLVLPAAVAAPTTAEVARGERFLIGGTAGRGDGGEVASAEVVLFDEEAWSFATQDPMEATRSGHCTSVVSDTQIITFGGHDLALPRGDFLRWDDSVEAWKMASIMVEDFDDRVVAGCGPLADGRTLVLGTSAASTGIWSYTEATVGTVDPTLAFLPTPPDDPGAAAAFVAGPSMIGLADGDAWIGGGVDPRTGQSADTARELRAATIRFDPADAQPSPRAWGVLRRLDDAGRVVWGCGWRDLDRSLPAASLQVFDVETGSVGELIQLAEARAGCELSVLPGGAVLVTGGAEAPTAEIVMPYWE